MTHKNNYLNLSFNLPLFGYSCYKFATFLLLATISNLYPANI